MLDVIIAAIKPSPTPYSHNIPVVILGLIISGSFFMSAKAARGRPQLATRKGRGRRDIPAQGVVTYNIYVACRSICNWIKMESSILKWFIGTDQETKTNSNIK